MTRATGRKVLLIASAVAIGLFALVDSKRADARRERGRLEAEIWSDLGIAHTALAIYASDRSEVVLPTTRADWRALASQASIVRPSAILDLTTRRWSYRAGPRTARSAQFDGDDDRVLIVIPEAREMGLPYTGITFSGRRLYARERERQR